MNNDLLETLISSFDNKETLLKWLKKLEYAIENANVSFVESVVIESNELDDSFRVGINFIGGESIYSNYFNIDDSFTQAHKDALNSGITAGKVAEIDSKQNALTQTQLDAVNSGINATKVTEFEGKQDALTQTQLDAVNSGINATKVTEFEGKQDALTQTQLDAVNSGINATKVTEFEGKQNALSQTQLDAVNSGINATKVTEFEGKQDALSQTQLDNIANINNKVDKTSNIKQLYGTNDNGEQTTLNYDTDAVQFAIVQRGGMGAIYVPTTPNLPNDAVPKTYVDNKFAQKSIVLYDASSSNASLNWGYTSGIGNGVTVSNKDFTPYKYLICFTGNTDNHVGVIVNLINNYGGYGGRAIENAWKENGLVVDIVNISINSAKTSITPTFLQIWDNSDFTLNRGAIRTIVGVY